MRHQKEVTHNWASARYYSFVITWYTVDNNHTKRRLNWKEWQWTAPIWYLGNNYIFLSIFTFPDQTEHKNGWGTLYGNIYICTRQHVNWGFPAQPLDLSRSTKLSTVLPLKPFLNEVFAFGKVHPHQEILKWPYNVSLQPRELQVQQTLQSWKLPQEYLDHLLSVSWCKSLPQRTHTLPHCTQQKFASQQTHTKTDSARKNTGLLPVNSSINRKAQT